MRTVFPNLWAHSPPAPMLGAQAQSQVQGVRKRKLDLMAEVARVGRVVREGP